MARLTEAKSEVARLTETRSEVARLTETKNSVAWLTETKSSVAWLTETKSTVARLTETMNSVARLTETKSSVPRLTETKSTVARLTETKSTVARLTETNSTVARLTETKSTVARQTLNICSLFKDDMLNVCQFGHVLFRIRCGSACPARRVHTVMRVKTPAIANNRLTSDDVVHATYATTQYAPAGRSRGPRTIWGTSDESLDDDSVIDRDYVPSVTDSDEGESFDENPNPRVQRMMRR